MWRKTHLLTAAILVTLSGLVLSWALLPDLVERMGEHRIQEIFPGGDLQVDVRWIGFSGLDLGRLDLGPEGAPSISCTSLHLDYSLTGLRRKRLDRVDISGLTIRARYEEGRIILPGLSLPAASASDKGGTSSPAGSITVDEVTISGARLEIETPSSTLSLPFTLKVTPVADSPGEPLRTVVELFPGGRKVLVNADLDRRTGQLSLAGAGEMPFAFLAPFFPGKNLQGGLVFSVRAVLGLAPVRLQEWKVDGQLVGSALLPTGAGLLNRPEQPFHFSAWGDHRHGRIKMADLGLAGPVPAMVQGEGQIRYKEGGAVDITGAFDLVPAMSTMTAGPAVVDLAVAIDPDLGWQLRTETSLPGFSSDTGEGLVRSEAAHLAMTGQGRGIAGQLHWQLKLPSLELDRNGTRVRASGLAGSGELELDDQGRLESSTSLQTELIELAGPGPKGRLVGVGVNGRAGWQPDGPWNGDIAVTLAAGDFQDQNRTVYLPDLQLAGSVAPGPAGEGAPFLQGRIRFSGATVRDSESQVELRSVRGDLPFVWPPAGEVPTGRVEAADLLVRKESLGPVVLDIGQKGKGLRLSGRHENRLIAGLKVVFDGEIAPASDGDGRLTFSIPPVTVSGFSPARLLPGAGDLVFSGGFQAEGSFALGRSGPVGQARVTIDHGRLEDRGKGMLVEGLALDLLLPDLPDIRSAPAQELRFARAGLGDLELGPGSVLFQVESTDSLLIEKGGFSWCRGHVYTYALRLRPSRREYTLTLYCDRLHLAQLLGQFGITQVESDGTVNGRIPLLVRDGLFRFEDGFLYSSPGEGGEVRMAASEFFFAGVDRTSPRFSQLDFAAEALKHFRYNWVRLLFESEGDELVIRMRLDGRPAKRLPFAYQRELGRFARLEANSSGGILQPIVLDANFRLPLDRIMGYSSGIKELLDMMQ